MKAILLLLAGWLTCMAVAQGADETVPVDKPSPSVKPPLSANSVAIKAQLVEVRHDKDKKPLDPRARPKQLVITLTRMSKDDLGDCTVKWSILGTDMADHKLVAVGSGDVPVTLTNRAPQCITSEPPVIVTYTPAKPGSGGQGKPAKTIPASGQKMRGWCVQVLQGSALVGEQYDSMSTKAEMAKQAAQKPPKGK